MALPDTAGSFASTSTAKLLERLAYQVSATAHSPGADHVHDLRVAIRRFEQALITFREALPGREVKRIRRRLKSLMERAGDVRDCDVAQKILTKCEVAGVARLKERLSEERKAATPLLVAALRRWSARRTSSKWRAALLPVAPHQEFHPHLPKLARKYLTHGKAASGNGSVEELHEFRIEGKKLRYTVELLQPVQGAVAREWLEKLKAVQSALGDVHDCRMAREIAARFEAPAGLEEWLKRRQRKKVRDFRRLWEENFGNAAESRRLLEGLRHPARKPMGRSTGAVRAAAARQG